MILLYGLLVGIAFGYTLQRVGALDYDEILKSLRLLDLKIVKFMFFSIAVGAAGIFFFNTLGIGTVENLPLYPGVLVGGLIFGVGFALSGYCPGTVVGAMAEGKKDAIYVFFGGFCGTFAYALLHKYIKPILIDRGNVGQLDFAGILNLPPLFTALIFAGIITIAMFIIDKKIPARDDL